MNSRLSGQEVLADQAGADGVCTFTFSAPVHEAIIGSVGTGTLRINHAGGTPSTTAGLAVPTGTPVTIRGEFTVVKIYCPAAATAVMITGWRY